MPQGIGHPADAGGAPDAGPAAGGRCDRLSAIGAVTLRPYRPSFYFPVLPDNQNLRGPDVITALRQLRPHVLPSLPHTAAAVFRAAAAPHRCRRVS